MFSSVYNTACQEVDALSRTAVESDLSLMPGSLDFKIARYLWTEGFGQGGTLDASIANHSVVVKSGMFRGDVFPIVPVYVTSICAEQCLYCNFRAANKGVGVERLRLSDEELTKEVVHLVEEKGLRVVELVYATDPQVRIDAMCRQVLLVRRLLDQHGGGMVGINAEALDEAEYRNLLSAGLSFAVLWQETYDRSRYRMMHPGSTKKTRFEYRLDAYERMLAAGIPHIGMGILSGLAEWRFDWAMLMFHEAYLYDTYGMNPSILGIPRLKRAAGAAVQSTDFIPTEQEFSACVSLHNIFSPVTMPFVSTREEWDLCVKLSGGGGCLFTLNCSTIPGGYSLGHRGYQFPTASYDAPEFASKLRQAGLSPVFDWAFLLEGCCR